MMGNPRAVKPMATYYADMAENSSQPAPIKKPEHKPTAREKVTAWALLLVIALVEVGARYWGVKS